MSVRVCINVNIILIKHIFYSNERNERNVSFKNFVELFLNDIRSITCAL